MHPWNVKKKLVMKTWPIMYKKVQVYYFIMASSKNTYRHNRELPIMLNKRFDINNTWYYSCHNG